MPSFDMASLLGGWAGCAPMWALSPYLPSAALPRPWASTQPSGKPASVTATCLRPVEPAPILHVGAWRPRPHTARYTSSTCCSCCWYRGRPRRWRLSGRTRTAAGMTCLPSGPPGTPSLTGACPGRGAPHWWTCWTTAGLVGGVLVNSCAGVQACGSVQAKLTTRLTVALGELLDHCGPGGWWLLHPSIRSQAGICSRSVKL